MGAMIAQRRKGMGMTQLELANKMGATDKAVSKWERNLSCPDIQFHRCVKQDHISAGRDIGSNIDVYKRQILL